MKYAILFKDIENPRIVYADEVKSGAIDKNEEFLHPKYEEFKVQYVKGAKNNGAPYFRLYYSYEEYKKNSPIKPLGIRSLPICGILMRANGTNAGRRICPISAHSKKP